MTADEQQAAVDDLFVDQAIVDQAIVDQAIVDELVDGANRYSRKPDGTDDQGYKDEN